MSDDDETPQLPSDTLAILQDFLNQRNGETDSEDWQLSQFWYNEETTTCLSESIQKLAKSTDKIALISCPTLMQPLLDRNLDVILFEYDKRFDKFQERFHYYDYRNPQNVNPEYHCYFDFIVADPPFLSEECLSKTYETIQILCKYQKTPIILCTGAIMEDLAFKLADLKPCSFEPKHKNNLANEFKCFTNFGELPL